MPENETRSQSPKRNHRSSEGRDSAVHLLGSLTTREREVLRWLAEAKRDAEIAVILGISISTVRKHVQNVFRKLHVENRTAAARIAGLLDGAGSKASRSRQRNPSGE